MNSLGPHYTVCNVSSLKAEYVYSVWQIKGALACHFLNRDCLIGCLLVYQSITDWTA